MIWRGDGQNRVAACLLVLFDQINPHYPGRATGNDGTLGDASHQAHKSDHNPDDQGIVRALDITHDPAHGFNSYAFADYLREHWDDRIQYLISNSRIANADIENRAWRFYGGGDKDPHDHHVHISARGDARADDPRPWDLTAFFDGSATTDPHPRIKLGAEGAPVLELQRLLGLPGTGIFDPATDLAVRSFQGSHGLEVDGIVGPLTWDALTGKPIEIPADVMTSKGSWYSQYRGKFTWVDPGDAPGSAALGIPDDAQGIARPGRETLGSWFKVRAPNGKVSIEIQSDLGPAAFTGRTIDISAAAAERFGYSPQNFPTDSIFTFWPVNPPKEVAGLSKQQQAIKYRDIRASLPVDGDVLPPKFDQELIIALILVLSEGTAMDEKLKQAMLAELRKPNPDFRSLLLQALGAPGVPTLPPPPPPPPPTPSFDFAPYMPLLQSPIVQQLLSGKPITLADLMPLIPDILAISQGQPIPALPPPPPKPPALPAPVTPVAPPFANNANNWSAGMAAALAALGLSGAGIIGSPIPGDPTFSLAGMVSFLGPLFTAGIAPWIGPFISGVFSKLTAKAP